jgi:hypothetical protein
VFGLKGNDDSFLFDLVVALVDHASHVNDIVGMDGSGGLRVDYALRGIDVRGAYMPGNDRKHSLDKWRVQQQSVDDVLLI